MHGEIYSTNESFAEVKAKAIELFDEDHEFITSSVWVGEMLGQFVEADGSADDHVTGMVFGFYTSDGEKHEFYTARTPMGAIGAMLFIKAMDDHTCETAPFCAVEVLAQGMRAYLNTIGIAP